MLFSDSQNVYCHVTIFSSYRMYTGSGGGLCDCGDPEAFSSHHTCSLHKSDTAGVTMHESLAKLPTDMRSRTEFLFKKIVKYVLDLSSKKSKVDYVYLCEVDKETWPELKHATEVPISIAYR